MTLSLRNRELFSLLVVGLVTGVGFASVYIARRSNVSWTSLWYAGLFFALFLAAHAVARMTVPNADPYLLPMAALLTAIGLTEIYRLDPHARLSTASAALRQGVWMIVGLGLFALVTFALRRDYRRVESYKYLFGLAAIVLLALPALPGLGRTINGARLWVGVGGLQFQPGEFAKICLIVFLAAYLREKREVLAQGRLKDLGPLLLIWGGAMLVLFETKDLGGGLLYYGIFIAMLYIATARLAYVIVGLLLFVGGSVAVWETVPRVKERVDVWVNPWKYAHTIGYQITQSSYSLAAGGIGGAGIGRGTVATTTGQSIIPFASTDFIFSVIAQEIGLVGVAAFLIVYMLFALRGMRIALFAQDGFSKLLAAGLTFAFALQTFIIVGGILRIIPLTGITLPFVSYGGSSLLANFVLVAGLLLVSHRANTARGEEA